MCGIVGVYAFGSSASPVSPGLLDKMRDTMSHRGPDGSQSWISGDGMVGLGFRRQPIWIGREGIQNFDRKALARRMEDIWQKALSTKS